MPENIEIVEKALSAFEEFKSANDARLKEIEKRGAADTLLEEKVNRINSELDKFEGYGQKIAAADARAKAAEEKSDELAAIIAEIEKKAGRIGGGGRDAKVEMKSKVNAWGRAVHGAFTLGVPNLSADQQKALSEVQAEYKALNVGTDTAGGYLAPTAFVAEIIKGVTEMSPMRPLVRVRSSANKSIELPKRTGQFAAQWTSEQGTKSETTGLTYGLEEIQAHEMYALVDISNQMLEDSAFDMEAEIRGEAVEQFELAEGTAIVTGSGVGRPEGFMTNAGVGSVNSGSATAVTGDGILTLKHSVKTAYARNATFLLNRTTLGSVRKLKDSYGQYIWMPGIQFGRPNTLDGDPYVEVPDMPSEAANAYPIAYGDWRRAYTLVDRISMEMLRDPYTQATAGNVRFIFRRRLGGKVTLAEAISKLKCST